jgi:hypothetical protein
MGRPHFCCGHHVPRQPCSRDILGIVQEQAIVLDRPDASLCLLHDLLTVRLIMRRFVHAIFRTACLVLSARKPPAFIGRRRSTKQLSTPEDKKKRIIAFPRTSAAKTSARATELRRWLLENRVALAPAPRTCSLQNSGTGHSWSGSWRISIMGVENWFLGRVSAQGQLGPVLVLGSPKGLFALTRSQERLDRLTNPGFGATPYYVLTAAPGFNNTRTLSRRPRGVAQNTKSVVCS